MSRKSGLLSRGSPAKPPSEFKEMKPPPSGKPGQPRLPPKSPFVMKAKKIEEPQSPVAAEDNIAPNYVSFAAQSPKAKPTGMILPEVRQSPSNREASSSVLSP